MVVFCVRFPFLVNELGYQFELRALLSRLLTFVRLRYLKTQPARPQACDILLFCDCFCLKVLCRSAQPGNTT